MEEVFDIAVASDQTVVEQSFSLTVERAALLKALKVVSGVIESSQILQILSHVKLQASGNELTVVATDSEVELVSTVPLLNPVDSVFAITVPGRKLLDICRTLPDGVPVTIECSQSWVKVCAADSIEFTLVALASEGFPVIRMDQDGQSFVVSESAFALLLGGCAFAMAHSDVRHFLNGMLLSFQDALLKVTATDGHRLAIDYAALSAEVGGSVAQAIVPRKAVLELVKLLGSAEGDVKITVTGQHIRFAASGFVLATRLLEGEYPDCERLIPDYDGTKAVVSRALFKSALSRAAVLAKEKYHGVRLTFRAGQLIIASNNSDNESAQEDFAIDYEGEDISIAFNISYLLDVVNVLSSADIDFILSDPKKCVLLKEYQSGESHDALYVIMPMTL